MKLSRTAPSVAPPISVGPPMAAPSAEAWRNAMPGPGVGPSSTWMVILPTSSSARAIEFAGKTYPLTTSAYDRRANVIFPGDGVHTVTLVEQDGTRRSMRVDAQTAC